jgi:hypothetical protein
MVWDRNEKMIVENAGSGGGGVWLPTRALEKRQNPLN